MIVVIDTNVLIAAFASEGLCHSLFEVCVDQHEIYISSFILHEVADNLQKKLKLPRKVINDIYTYLEEVTTLRNPPKLEKKICRDTDDDQILSLAADSSADYLITGDQDLLVMKNYKKIPIITLREFWEILRIKK